MLEEWQLIALLVNKLGGRVTLTLEDIERARGMALEREEDFISRGIILHSWSQRHV